MVERGAFPQMWSRNELMPFPSQFDVDTGVHVLLGVGTAAVVTAGRVALLSVWPDFKTATDTSNRQVC
eukprot:753509-Prorocentrum_minimum.AAC.4